MFQVFQKHHILSENMKRLPFQFKIMQCSSKLSNSGIFFYCQMYFQCSYAKVFSSLEQFSITCMVQGRNVRSWSINNVHVTNRWLGYTMLLLINYWELSNCPTEVCWGILLRRNMLNLPFFDMLRWTLPTFSVKGFRSGPCLFPNLHLLIADDIASFR